MIRIGNHAGAFEISTLPGQPQVAICHSFFVAEDQRGKGLSHALKLRQAAELRSNRFDFAICTVAATNGRQKSALTRAGWQKLAEFRNSRQSETTELWGLTVNPNALEEASEAAA